MVMLTFRVGAERYAVPASALVEVIPRVPLRAIAFAPPELLGVFMYRGAATAVLDLSMLLGGAPCAERLSTRILVVRDQRAAGARMVGLLAEGITGVLREHGPMQPGLPTARAPFLAEVFDHEGGLVQVLDAPRLVAERLHAVLALPEVAGAR